MRRRRTTRCVRVSLAAGACALAGLALLVPRVASATEPKKANEPRIMSEPGEVTNVVDAFDEENGNPFDIHITLGYQQSWLGAKIRRENYVNQPGLSSGGFTTNLMNVATYKEVVSRLNTRVDIGIFKDIGLYARLPLILSKTGELTDLGGSVAQQQAILQGAPGEQLFTLPFKSPTRSGIEYFAVGVDLGIFNQARDPNKPTWIFGFEGRFSVGDPMHACAPAAGTGLNQHNQQVQCADPSDYNRDGVANNSFGPDKAPLEGNQFSARNPGVSRGTTAIEIHSVMSRRVKYVEPYGGFRALLEFANTNSDYGQLQLNQVLTSSPPLQGSMIAGIQFIPWEQREQYQRLSFDVRFTGTYRSEGRDYTPLYDALGSSDAPSIRQPSYAEYTAGNTQVGSSPGTGSVVNKSSQKVYVTGLTDTAAHGSFQIAGSAQFQAAEYIKFQVGVGYTHIQAHNITGDQPCNPNLDHTDRTKSGPCQTIGQTTVTATGVPNPLYRPAVDIVGRRFFMDDANQWDAWVHAVVMF